MALDPSLTPHLQVQATDVAGVWNVRLPHWPWQYARAEEEREALVRRIADVAPVRRLWLSDSPDDTHGQWLTLSPDQTLGAAGGAGLTYGDWLLLFIATSHSASSSHDQIAAAAPNVASACCDSSGVFG